MKYPTIIACVYRTVSATILVALCFAPLLAAAQNNPGNRENSHEKTLFQLANRSRTAEGLRPLLWDEALAAAAGRHAILMARQNALSHQFKGEAGLEERTAQSGAHFSTIAENIAEGPDAAGIHEQWMKSPPHRRNLLDPQLDSVGIAVVDDNGQLFAVEDFSQAVNMVSIADQEKTVTAQLQSHGLRILNYTEDLRRTCAMDNGYTGSHMPSFVVHYFTADLRMLPPLLEQRIQTGQYHSAAVGACKPEGRSNFTQYRMAVMLFE